MGLGAASLCWAGDYLAQGPPKVSSLEWGHWCHRALHMKRVALAPNAAPAMILVTPGPVAALARGHPL